MADDKVTPRIERRRLDCLDRAIASIPSGRMISADQLVARAKAFEQFVEEEEER